MSDANMPRRYTEQDFLAAMDYSQFVAGPVVQSSDQKRAAFHTFYQSVIVPAEGAGIKYDLPYPKHELLTYLVEEQPVLLHGSNNGTIVRFDPRQAVDATEIGSQAAVYAASDPFVPIWFAVLDRTRSYGSEPFAISSLFRWRSTSAGQRVKVYYFAVSAEALRQQPWTTGAVYVLPQQTFVPDIVETQWLSREAVVPLARLQLEPSDFPFRHQVYGMDVAKVWQRMQHSLKGYPWVSDREIHPIRPQPV